MYAYYIVIIIMSGPLNPIVTYISYAGFLPEPLSIPLSRQEIWHNIGRGSEEIGMFQPEEESYKVYKRSCMDIIIIIIQ